MRLALVFVVIIGLATSTLEGDLLDVKEEEEGLLTGALIDWRKTNLRVNNLVNNGGKNR